MKRVSQDGSNLGVIAGSGLLDSARGSALRSSLHQLIDLFVKDEKVVTAEQTANVQQVSIKLGVKLQVDSIMAEFLASMGFVAKAFGMHLPNQLVTDLTKNASF